MARTAPPSEVGPWRREGSTTVLLERNDDGRWRATQHGVDVAGHGETAALAAADYCRRLADR